MINVLISEIENVLMGSVQVEKAYHGTQLVWQAFKGFTFEGAKDRDNRISFTSMEETDPTKLKNMWVIIDSVDRLIWAKSSGNVLKIDASRRLLSHEDSSGKKMPLVFYDTGEELLNGSYTFKVELI